MNRELKFRAWNDGVMIYEKDIPHILMEDNQVLRLARFWCNIRNNSKIMQYTGLKDKNGKEIYEGDIVQTPCGHSLVEFSHGVFGLNHDFMNPERKTMLGSWGQEHNLRSLDDGYYKNISVIGNIYQNN